MTDRIWQEAWSAFGRPISRVINRSCCHKANLNSQWFDLLEGHCCCCWCSSKVGLKSRGHPPSCNYELENVTLRPLQQQRGIRMGSGPFPLLWTTRKAAPAYQVPVFPGVWWYCLYRPLSDMKFRFCCWAREVIFRENSARCHPRPGTFLAEVA